MLPRRKNEARLAALSLLVASCASLSLVAKPLDQPEPPTRAAPPADAASTDVAALVARWAGDYDLTEQLFFDAAPTLDRPLGAQQRLQLVVTPIEVPWLAAQVLYLEEFLYDDPSVPRRQVILRLTAGQQTGTVRAQQYTLRRPARWRALARRPDLAAQLTAADVDAHPGCDLLMVREAEQFRGRTLGRACRDGGKHQYVEYELLLGEDLYWYRQRVLGLPGGELQRELAGFTLIDVDNARLFSCVVVWHESADLARQLLTLDLHDQGGHGNFTTPDGRRWRITLYGHDWSFADGRDALQLVLAGLPPNPSLARSWTASAERVIALDVDRLSLQCAPIVPERDDVAA